MRRGKRTLVVVLAFLLGAASLPLLHSGNFDTAPPAGMVDDPCATARDRLALPGALLRNPAELERLRDKAGLCHFRADNERLAAAGIRPEAVMLGDSITAIWREQDPAFFAQGTVARGIGGQSSAQLLQRFEQDVVALHPRAVHIMVGLNDIAGNDGLTRAEDFQANVRAMVAIAEANDIAVVLGSVTPATRFFWRPGIDPRARIAALNRWLKTFAAERGIPFADYHAVLAERDGSMKAPFDEDGSHPTAAGYAAMRPVAEAALAEAAAQAGRGG